MSSFKDHSGLSQTFLDSASAVLFCLDDINEAYAHNFLFFAKQPKYFIYFKNFIVARFLFIYTTNHNHAVNFKMESHVFSDLYNTFLMQNMLLRLLIN